MGCHFLLQGIFPTQRSNLNLLHLLHCRRVLYHIRPGLNFRSLVGSVLVRIAAEDGFSYSEEVIEDALMKGIFTEEELG